MITILLVDDYPVVRRGLKGILETVKDFKVIGEASGGLEAIPMANRLHPNVILLDLMMKGITGIETARQITSASKDIGIIIFSALGNENYVTDALRAGVLGYVLKEAPCEELIYAIREVAAGRKFLGVELKGQVYHTQPIEDIQANRSQLTVREKEVLQLLAQGNTCAEVAYQFNISKRTVEAHRANMIHKLKLPNSSALYRYALKQGMLQNNTPQS
jgi:DNA-binding NarL/FixJ family response regulator